MKGGLISFSIFKECISTVVGVLVEIKEEISH
jgi:hypothetical protein